MFRDDPRELFPDDLPAGFFAVLVPDFFGLALFFAAGFLPPADFFAPPDFFAPADFFGPPLFDADFPPFAGDDFLPPTEDGFFAAPSDLEGAPLFGLPRPEPFFATVFADGIEPLFAAPPLLDVVELPPDELTGFALPAELDRFPDEVAPLV